jgi:glutamyl-tRNA reductase
VLICLSASYRQNDFKLLGRLAEIADPVSQRTTRLPDVAGAVCVSTCNRFELYLDAPGCDVAADVIGLVAADLGVAADTLANAFTVRADGDAFAHLCQVASGLDSLAVGEVEVSGQVARSLLGARAQDSTTALLERAFQQAAHAAHRIKATTALNGVGRSVVGLALDLAEAWAADWRRCRVLLIGTGRYARVCVAALRARGITQIEVTSTSGREATFAEGRELIPVPIGQLDAALARADVVLATTRGGTRVVSAERLAAVRRASGRGAQLLIDLALPGNLDPAIAELRGCSLLDIETIRLHQPWEEAHATDQALALIEAAVAEFTARMNYEQLDAQLVELRQRGFALAEQEEQRPGSSQRPRHLMARALDPLMRRARQLAADGRQEEVAHAIELLFGVSAASPGSKSGSEPELRSAPGWEPKLELGSGSELDLAARPKVGDEPSARMLASKQESEWVLGGRLAAAAGPEQEGGSNANEGNPAG